MLANKKYSIKVRLLRGDGHLAVEFCLAREIQEHARKFTVWCREKPLDLEDGFRISSGVSPVLIAGLRNGVTYDVSFKVKWSSGRHYPAEPASVVIEGRPEVGADETGEIKATIVNSMQLDQVAQQLAAGGGAFTPRDPGTHQSASFNSSDAAPQLSNVSLLCACLLTHPPVPSHSLVPPQPSATSSCRSSAGCLSAPLLSTRSRTTSARAQTRPPAPPPAPTALASAQPCSPSTSARPPWGPSMCLRPAIAAAASSRRLPACPPLAPRRRTAAASVSPHPPPPPRC